MNRTTDVVIVTPRQRRHYLGRHPEIAGREPEIVRAITDPDEVHMYASNRETANLYLRLEDRPSHYLLVSVAISFREDRQNSVLSVRIARERELRRGRAKRRMIWRREE
jgi:hypothetical protein